MKKSLLALCFASALFAGNGNLPAQEATTNSVKTVQKAQDPQDPYEALTKKFEESLDMAQTNKQAFRFYHESLKRVIKNNTDSDKQYVRGFDGNGVSCSYIPDWTHLSFDDGEHNITLSGDAYGRWHEFRGVVRKRGNITGVDFELSREIPGEKAERLVDKMKLLSNPTLNTL